MQEYAKNDEGEWAKDFSANKVCACTFFAPHLSFTCCSHFHHYAASGIFRENSGEITRAEVEYSMPLVTSVIKKRGKCVYVDSATEKFKFTSRKRGRLPTMRQ